MITPSLPERAEQLVEAAASVQNQTLQADLHLIALDAAREGPAICRNRLLAKVETPFVAFLDDDDLLYPDHLALLMRCAEDEGPQRGPDLVYSWHDGGPGVPRFEEFGEAAADMMHSGRNVIPISVLARTDAILRCGGFDPADRWEDYSLWLRMMRGGAWIYCVPEVTWHYRIAEDGRTWNP